MPQPARLEPPTVTVIIHLSSLTNSLRNHALPLLVYKAFHYVGAGEGGN